MDESVMAFFEVYPGTPIYNVEKPDYRGSVKFSDYRLNKAKEQTNELPKSIADIVNYVNELFVKLCIEVTDNPVVKDPLNINYEAIKEKYKLKYIQDIIWMKFTIDGYLGVVATSNDINFNKNNTSGILIQQLNKIWDTSFVLVFPLSNIPIGYNRGDIERAVGNYL